MKLNGTTCTMAPLVALVFHSQTAQANFLRSLQTQLKSCVADNECNIESEYCVAGLCQDFGYCRDIPDCVNPSNQYPDIRCVGNVVCTDNQCGRICNGGEGDNSPIEVLPVPEIGTVGTCSSKEDCPSDQYCSAGTCREMGTCATAQDCQNPTNLFNNLLCIGRPICNDDGTCGVICGDCQAPDTNNGQVQQDSITCSVPPCDSEAWCGEATMCHNDFCGGCEAVFFNDMGKTVNCTAENDEDDSSVKLTGLRCSLVNSECHESSMIRRYLCRARRAIARATCNP